MADETHELRSVAEVRAWLEQHHPNWFMSTEQRERHFPIPSRVAVPGKLRVGASHTRRCVAPVPQYTRYHFRVGFPVSASSIDLAIEEIFNDENVGEVLGIYFVHSSPMLNLAGVPCDGVGCSILTWGRGRE